MSDSVPDERLYADVILPLATPAMTFSVPEHLAGELAEGSCVIVQLGARKYYTGVVRRIHGDRPVAAKVKPVERTVGDRPAATSVQLRLWDWLASYYMCPLGLVMRAAVPAALKSGGLSVQEAVDGTTRLRRRLSSRCIRRSATRRICMPLSIRCRGLGGSTGR